MGQQTMDRTTAGRFVEAWCANWCKVDIDAVVSHFAENAAAEKAATELLAKYPMLQIEIYDASSRSRTLVK